MSDRRGGHKRRRRPPETYLEAAFVWRVKRLSLTQQVRLYSDVGGSRRQWWEWTEEGWREIA